MKTVVVTGCSRGIGLEFVRQLLARGDRVFAGVRRPESATVLMNLAAAAPEQLTVLPLDVTQATHRANLAATLGSRGIDLLISNAGVYGPVPDRLGETDEDGWLETFRVNAIAPRQLVEALLPQLRAGNRPCIGLLSSKMGSMGDNGSGGVYIYRSSKAALNAVGVSLARDLRDQGILTLVLHPGWVLTDMGGPNAEITVSESVTRMLAILDGASADDNGRFIDIDGSTIPW
ncbi:Short chain dehydrogenase [Thioalkalivibrio nitratireducens DSM 14787]|uniref:Short chain dehydrogenase n=1 Tax=Thioalkalivibrio nitratireducens (strain DSM 14787 / UNIQEM 213 / ALEN2) TaxID=1255043 RepID=L0DTE3_THIND|nr:SDR family oxidoreductase [Thioalkalivibrio nitratireducens]AGA32859.1 Short chain dehydrogenase [Thioalkalivibrio nitratireducens DSM 14787]